MSTISGSTTDTNLKYQRLSSEFVKIRNQVSVLKTALLEEQARNQETQSEIVARDTKLRKLASEHESLVFRNEQLVKRVETLQNTLDSNNAAFTLAKNKKKHKEANLRLFGETSRQQIAGGQHAEPILVMEQELERKLIENGELHSKIFDIEKQHDSVVNKLVQKIDQLELENINLKKSSSESPLPSTSSQKPSSSSLGQEDANLSAQHEDQNGLLDGEHKLMAQFYTEKIRNLSDTAKHSNGRAEYYKRECETLVRRSIYDLQQKTVLEKRVEEMELKCACLDEELETTRKNYEDQMRGLYEHMSEQDAKIVEQSECISQLKSLAGRQGQQSLANNQQSTNHPRDTNGSLSQNLRKMVGK
uniref:Protein phosphatase 1 regulatory subunit 21 n=1 Tax=Ditylenchus dipsaci TaxID=166011 RepID=A0A915D789_9BILA